MKITTEYVRKEYFAFRKIMGSTKYDAEQKLKAWEGLITEYVRMEVEDNEEDRDKADIIQASLVALQSEFSTRLGYEDSQKITRIKRENQRIW